MTFQRARSNELTERFREQVIVDNRPGAGGNVGVEIASKSPPDGYTLLLVSSSYGRIPRCAKLSFDPVNGFEPITLVPQQPFILVVHPSLPARNVKELIALAKASRVRSITHHPARAGSFISARNTSRVLPASISFTSRTRAATRLTTISSPASSGLFRNDSFDPASGQIGGASRARREHGEANGALPSVPTVAEAGVPGFSFSGWYAVLAPAKTPKDDDDGAQPRRSSRCCSRRT